MRVSCLWHEEWTLDCKECNHLWRWVLALSLLIMGMSILSYVFGLWMGARVYG